MGWVLLLRSRGTLRQQQKKKNQGKKLCAIRSIKHIYAIQRSEKSVVVRYISNIVKIFKFIHVSVQTSDQLGKVSLLLSRQQVEGEVGDTSLILFCFFNMQEKKRRGKKKKRISCAKCYLTHSKGADVTVPVHRHSVSTLKMFY